MYPGLERKRPAFESANEVLNKPIRPERMSQIIGQGDKQTWTVTCPPGGSGQDTAQNPGC